MEERASKPTQLLLKEIKTDEATFQWRVSQFNKVESAEQLRVLTQALQNSNKPLDPLQVFQKDDGYYYVMEGHHRLAAYRKARWKKPIPVTVFEGTLEQARLAALEANVKDKLRLSGPEKREARVEARYAIQASETQQGSDCRHERHRPEHSGDNAQGGQSALGEREGPEGLHLGQSAAAG